MVIPSPAIPFSPTSSNYVNADVLLEYINILFPQRMRVTVRYNPDRILSFVFGDRMIVSMIHRVVLSWNYLSIWKMNVRVYGIGRCPVEFILKVK